MTVRELPLAEWSKLAGTELAHLADVAPKGWRVLVVEDDAGAILGTWATVMVAHTEGLWIHPAHRKLGGVARRLLMAMRALLVARGEAVAWTAAATEDVATILEKLHGTKVPADSYVWPVKTVVKSEETVCQPS